VKERDEGRLPSTKELKQGNPLLELHQEGKAKERGGSEQAGEHPRSVTLTPSPFPENCSSHWDQVKKIKLRNPEFSILSTIKSIGRLLTGW